MRFQLVGKLIERFWGIHLEQKWDGAVDANLSANGSESRRATQVLHSEKFLSQAWLIES